MGRIVTQVRLTNFTDPSKTLAISALVDTGSAYITLPNAWRESLGDIEQLGEVELELADQTVKKGIVCGPVRVRIGEFRPIVGEVLFRCRGARMKEIPITFFDRRHGKSKFSSRAMWDNIVMALRLRLKSLFRPRRYFPPAPPVSE